jgi:MPBQ/MSBQ methyltransferase
VGREYDAWTTEGILERYWGEHIHLGYYSDEDIAKGYRKKDFKLAKYDFIDEMMKFGGVTEFVQGRQNVKILDCGCGIGGTSRYLARKLGTSTCVHGITLSTEQVVRASQLAAEQNIPNVNFEVMDALNMTFPDNTFDIVWACESGEHMPDKKRYQCLLQRVSVISMFVWTDTLKKWCVSSSQAES